MTSRPRSRKAKKRLNVIAARRILEGKSDEEIMKETGLNVFEVTGVRGILRTQRGRNWAKKHDLPIEEPPGESVPPRVASEEPSEGVEASLEKPRDETMTSRTGSRQALPLAPEEVILEVEGIPVGRRIRLSPKNLMFYDWFRTKYGYGGDLSDFINDAIDDFFKSRNWTIKVVKEEEIA